MHSTSAKLAASKAAAFGIACAVHGIACAQTRIIHVDNAAPVGGDGTTWQSAYRELADAVAQLNNTVWGSDVEVRIAQGTYRPRAGTPLGTPGFELQVRATVSAVTFSLLGAFAGLRGLNPDARDFVRTPTIISGDMRDDDGPNFTNRQDNVGPLIWSHRRWNGEHAGVVMRMNGLRVRGGRFVPDYSDQWTPVGGGAFVQPTSNASASEISDCIFEDNEGLWGGGLCASGFNADAIWIQRCTFRGNRAVRYGGGLYVTGTAELCEITGNEAPRGGGVSVGQWHNGRLRRCVVAENRAEHGGGVHAPRYSTVVSCLLVANSASGSGGGLYGSQCSVVNCSIVDNYAVYGGGAHFGNETYVDAYNTIFAGNNAETNGNEISVSTPYVTFFSCCIPGGQSGIFNPFGSELRISDLHVADPEFRDPAGPDGSRAAWRDNDYRLVPSSSLLDSNYGGGLPTPFGSDSLDLDGVPRIAPRRFGGELLIDIGCYEFQPSLCPADITTDGGVTIDDLLAFLVFLEEGNWRADLDDGSSTGRADGGVNVDDLLFFLSRYHAGC